MSISTQVQNSVTRHYEDPTELLLDPNDNENKLVPLFMFHEMEGKEGMGQKFVEKTHYSMGSAASASATVSDTIAAGATAGATPSTAEWLITPVSYDGSFTFHRDDIDACEGPDEQFDVIRNRIDMALKLAKQRLTMYVGGDGNAAITQITAITSSTVTVPRSAANKLKKGDSLVAATAVTGGTFYGTAIEVSGVVPRTGVVTLAADPTSVWANNAALYLFFEGDRGAVITGSKAWIDDTSTTLFGVTRTGIPELQGLVVDCLGMTTVEALTEIADVAFSRGIQQDAMVVSGTTWKLLQREKDFSKSLVTYTGGNSKYEVGFQAYSLATIFGSLPILPDVYHPAGESISGPFKSKEYRPRLVHNNSAVVTLEGHDNLEFRRSTSAGSRTYSGNVYFRGQSIWRPGKYVRGINLPTS